MKNLLVVLFAILTLRECVRQPEPVEPILEVPMEIIGMPVNIQVEIPEISDQGKDEIFEMVVEGEDGSTKIYCKNGKSEVSVKKGGKWIILWMGETSNCNPETMLRFIQDHQKAITQYLVDMGFTGEEIDNLMKLLEWYIQHKKE